jgi:hypothetical protein
MNDRFVNGYNDVGYPVKGLKGRYLRLTLLITFFS